MPTCSIQVFCVFVFFKKNNQKIKKCCFFNSLIWENVHLWSNHFSQQINGSSHRLFLPQKRLIGFVTHTAQYSSLKLFHIDKWGFRHKKSATQLLWDIKESVWKISLPLDDIVFDRMSTETDQLALCTITAFRDNVKWPIKSRVFQSEVVTLHIYLALHSFYHHHALLQKSRLDLKSLFFLKFN